MLVRSLVAGVVLLLLTGAAGAFADEAARPNVLMIWVDDLRPEIRAYGVEHMETPNLDRLAERALRFDRAYCNIPVCGASRASVMTGMRGTRQRFVSYDTRAGVQVPGKVAMHKHFRHAGYTTAYYGKVFHFEDDLADGWSEGDDFYDWPGYTKPESQALFDEEKAARGPAWEVAEVDDEDLADGRIAAAACEAIDRFANAEQPFFLAVGFYKPHLPFVAPAKYWETHPVDSARLPENYTTRPDAPWFAFTNWGELRSYHEIPKRGPVSDDAARNLVAGYRACVGFTDAQIGKVLDRLEASGEAENTVIVLLGDHGWNLGEHGMWCKHCCFETSMRSTLMIAAPSVAGFESGQSTEALTEFIDLYPTLCELTAVDPPEPLQGKSLVPVLKDAAATHREAAIGRYGVGDTIRTDRYRYSFYRTKRHGVGRMLYDHQNDPNEDNNLAEDPEHAATVERLHKLLLKEMGK